MIFSLITSVKLVKDIIKIKAADKRLTEVEQERELARQEQEKLRLQLAEVNDSRWFEKQVRDVLKMARPEEVVVVVPEEVGKQADGPHFAEASRDESLSNFQRWIQIFTKWYN